MNVSLLNYTIHTYHSGTRFHCINPRSREGSDVQMLRLQFSYILISIHAPARGATNISLLSQIFYNHFNPRSREGSAIMLTK